MRELLLKFYTKWKKTKSDVKMFQLPKLFTYITIFLFRKINEILTMKMLKNEVITHVVVIVYFYINSPRHCMTDEPTN